MAAGTAAIYSTFLFFGVYVFVSAEPKVITANSGQNATLTCQAPNNSREHVKWSRADLRDEYVLLYLDGHFDSHNQHPSFKNRVDLQDRQMKDGDASLILKNVTINDTGTYECRVFMGEPSSQELNLIKLTVIPPAQKIIRVSGQKVTLPCRAPSNNIRHLEWNRADLKPQHLFLYQHGHSLPDEQHPSFKNRVHLQDKEMKDGDVSLILTDVTINDCGTYICRVNMEETGSRKNSSISSIYLRVVPKTKTITAESGQKNVTLTCRAPNNNIIVLEWRRADLEDENVLLYRDGEFVQANEHQFFKNRVDLRDRQMKDGDVSLILKNVTINDTGTYECCVVMEGTQSSDPISIITLTVDPPGQKGGSVGPIAGFSVFACFLVVLVVVVVVVVVVLFCKCNNSNSTETNPDRADQQMPMMANISDYSRTVSHGTEENHPADAFRLQTSRL